MRHTSNTGRYVTDEQRVIDLAGRGLLFDNGPQQLAGGMHYLVMAGRGAPLSTNGRQPNQSQRLRSVESRGNSGRGVTTKTPMGGWDSLSFLRKSGPSAATGAPTKPNPYSPALTNQKNYL